jgi:hypothetical protein
LNELSNANRRRRNRNRRAIEEGAAPSVMQISDRFLGTDNGRSARKARTSLDAPKRSLKPLDRFGFYHPTPNQPSRAYLSETATQ